MLTESSRSQKYTPEVPDIPPEERLPPLIQASRVKSRSSPCIPQDPPTMACTAISSAVNEPRNNKAASASDKNIGRGSLKGITSGEDSDKYSGRRSYLASAGYVFRGENDKLGQLLKVLSDRKQRASCPENLQRPLVRNPTADGSSSSSDSEVEEVGQLLGQKQFLPRLRRSSESVSKDGRKNDGQESGRSKLIAAGAVTKDHELSHLLSVLYKKEKKGLSVGCLKDLPRAKSKEMQFPVRHSLKDSKPIAAIKENDLKSHGLL